MDMSCKITRHKVPSLDANGSAYEVRRDGVPIGRAALTGRVGVDNYPWSWNLIDGVVPVVRERFGKPHSRSMGSTDTLGGAVEQIAEWASTTGGLT